MLKILKYFKPFVFGLLLAIALLYGQAMADLALPDYMSNVVNIGIQQGGNESAMPEILRQSDLEKINLFLNAQEQQKVQSHYNIIQEGTKNYNKLLKNYPLLESERAYERKGTEEDKEGLELLMSWQTTPQNKVRYLPGNLPGLDNFYLTGQWTMPPGGLPTAVMTGKWLIQRLCKKEKIKFKTSI